MHCTLYSCAYVHCERRKSSGLNLEDTPESRLLTDAIIQHAAPNGMKDWPVAEGRKCQGNVIMKREI